MTITKRSTRKRRGVMLTEVALAATLLGLITGTVAALMLTWRTQLRDLEHRQTAASELQRLHLALHADLLGASAVEVTEPVLEIHYGNQRRVVYRLGHEMIERKVYSEGALQQRDTYGATRLRELKWQPAAAMTGNRVTLSAVRGTQKTTQMSELLVLSWEAIP